MDLAGLADAFRDEAREHVQAIGADLLELERRPSDPAPIRALFLSAHTLKGAAATLGLAASRELAHAMEDVLAAARDRARPVAAETVQLLFQTVDRLAVLTETTTREVEPADVLLADQLREHAAVGPPPAAAPPRRGAPRALLVEDSATLRMLESMELGDAGIEVDAVADGREALARAGREQYDLIVSGVEVRGLRGLDLAAELRASAAYRDRPILLLSSDDVPADRRRAAELGVDGYIRRGSFGQLRLVQAAREALGLLAVQAGLATDRPVLVVDDSAANRLLTARLLERLGQRAELVDGGRAAVEALSSRPYALVLMDCQMPDLDGLAATREVRGREGVRQRTPILALTGTAGPGERAECLAAGMDEVLEKPVRIDDLAAALARWLRSPSTAEPAPAAGSAGLVDRSYLDWALESIEAGDRTEVAEIFGAFFDETQRRVDRLRELAARGDRAELRKVAHAVKGSAGSFGARELSRLAGEIEERAGGASGGPLDDLADQIAAAYGLTRPALEAILGC